MIAAVCVAFNPDDGFKVRLASFASQVERVFLIDNSTEPARAAFVQSLAGGNVEVIANGNEGGLARAQNIGLDKALDAGAEWIALFDDDSTAAPGMIAHMLEAKRLAGILVPELVDARTGHEHRFLAWRGPFIWRKRMGGEFLLDDIATASASGMLIHAQLLKDCGLMREEYFIDWLDIEFCLRAQAHGWRIAAIGGARLKHRLGHKEKHGAFIASHHSAARRYTISRNRADVWKTYFLRFPGYVLYDTLVSSYETLKIMCFEKEKSAKLCAIMRGFKDSLLDRFPNP
jgi:rhamnosyltransferase